MEYWRPVVGYEGRYDVSSEGRVRSYLTNKAEVLRTTPVILKSYLPKRSAYPCVGLCPKKPGRCRKARVHLLVLRAFKGPRPQGHEGSHINGKSTDCRLSNLAWETILKNNRRKHEHGTMHRKLTSAQVAEIRALVGGNTAEIAKRYGVARYYVYAIWNGTTRRSDG